MSASPLLLMFTAIGDQLTENILISSVALLFLYINRNLKSPVKSQREAIFYIH